jgi:hypothetical protein
MAATGRPERLARPDFKKLTGACYEDVVIVGMELERHMYSTVGRGVHADGDAINWDTYFSIIKVWQVRHWQYAEYDIGMFKGQLFSFKLSPGGVH